MPAPLTPLESRLAAGLSAALSCVESLDGRSRIIEDMLPDLSVKLAAAVEVRNETRALASGELLRQSLDGFEMEFVAMRLRRVANLCGAAVLDNNAQLVEVAGTVLGDVARRIVTMQAQHAETTAKLAATEARVDALMLEFCPEELTDEQKANWAAHQHPVAGVEAVLSVART